MFLCDPTQTDVSLTVRRCPNQGTDLNPIEYLWRDLKVAAHRHFPSRLMELEGICQEEWDKPPDSGCERSVETHPRKPGAVITATGACTRGIEDLNYFYSYIIKKVIICVYMFC